MYARFMSSHVNSLVTLFADWWEMLSSALSLTQHQSTAVNQRSTMCKFVQDQLKGKFAYWQVHYLQTEIRSRKLHKLFECSIQLQENATPIKILPNHSLVEEYPSSAFAVSVNGRHHSHFLPQNNQIVLIYFLFVLYPITDSILL